MPSHFLSRLTLVGRHGGRPSPHIKTNIGENGAILSGQLGDLPLPTLIRARASMEIVPGSCLNIQHSLSADGQHVHAGSQKFSRRAPLIRRMLNIET